MKVYILLYLLLLSTAINGQEQNWPVDVEIYIIIQGLSGGDEVGFSMKASSYVWKFNNQVGSWTFLTTNAEYDEVYYPGYCETVGNTNLPWAYGFNIAGSNSFNQPTTAHGVYRFEIYDKNCLLLPISFYLDYRDCDYPNVPDRAYRPDESQNPYLFPAVSGGPEIWILFDASTNTC